MKRHVEPTAENIAGWQEWVDSRPAVIKEMATRVNPWGLYRYRTTGQIVSLLALSENGTLRVNVHWDPSPLRGAIVGTVFGVPVDELEEIPDAEELPPLTGLRVEVEQ